MVTVICTGRLVAKAEASRRSTPSVTLAVTASSTDASACRDRSRSLLVVEGGRSLGFGGAIGPHPLAACVQVGCNTGSLLPAERLHGASGLQAAAPTWTCSAYTASAVALGCTSTLMGRHALIWLNGGSATCGSGGSERSVGVGERRRGPPAAHANPERLAPPAPQPAVRTPPCLEPLERRRSGLLLRAHAADRRRQTAQQQQESAGPHPGGRAAVLERERRGKQGKRGCRERRWRHLQAATARSVRSAVPCAHGLAALPPSTRRRLRFRLTASTDCCGCWGALGQGPQAASDAGGRPRSRKHDRERWCVG